MRGRYGLCMALAAALVIGVSGGCAKKTPEQRAQEKAHKQAVAQQKAQRKEAERQAKAQAEAEEKRLAAERKQAEEQARAAKKQAEEQARAAKKEAEAQARADAERAKADAKEQKRQAALAKAEAKKKKKAKPEEPVKYPDDEEWVVGHPYSKMENKTQLFDRHMQAMAASGAAEDAGLYDHHFDGGELNALGRSKVALMLQDAPKNEPLTIYVLPSGSDERLQARLAAVDAFWKQSQWAAVNVQTRQGINPQNTTPASAGLAGLRRMEQGEQGGGGGGASQGSSFGTQGAGGATGGGAAR